MTYKKLIRAYHLLTHVDLTLKRCVDAAEYTLIIKLNYFKVSKL